MQHFGIGKNDKCWGKIDYLIAFYLLLCPSFLVSQCLSVPSTPHCAFFRYPLIIRFIITPTSLCIFLSPLWVSPLPPQPPPCFSLSFPVYFPSYPVFFSSSIIIKLLFVCLSITIVTLDNLSEASMDVSKASTFTAGAKIFK